MRRSGGLAAGESLSRQALAGVASPRVNALMVAGHEDVGHGEAAIDGGSRVAWRAQATGPVGVGACAVHVRHRAFEESDGCVDDDERGGLTAAQDVVADGDFFGGEVVGDALVDVLVVAAEDREGVTGGVAYGVGVRERAAAGG